MSIVSLSPPSAGLLPRAIYQRIFERSSLGMLVYYWDDPSDLGSFRLVAQNAAAIRAGSSPNELGRRIDEVGDLLRTEIPARYAQVLTTEQPVVWDIDWRRADGEVVHYDVQCFPVDVRYVVVFFENTTEKRDVQAQLAKRMRELERSNRDLDDFAYVASHDLKSPLRDIHNLATWIAEDLGTNIPADTARHVKQLRDRVARMERLLDALLNYSRAGREPAARVSVSVRAVVADVVALLCPAHHRIVVEGTVDDVLASEVALTVVLRNLISNAIKHDDRDSGSIYVSAEEIAGATALCVRDEGPGIPSVFHDRVMRLFQTLKPRDQVESSGMGLALVKKILESHGGRVEILSEGRGTTIRTIWPKDAST